MNRIKIVGLAVVALLVLIIVLQNTEAVDTKFLFMTVTVPRAVLLFGTLIVGYLLGLLTASKVLTKKPLSASASED